MRSHRETVSRALVAVSLCAGLLSWPVLPAEMAIHFSATGTPDSYAPTPVGVLLIPATMSLTLVVLEKTTEVDPPDDEHRITVVVIATMGLVTALQLLVLAWNFGVPIRFDVVLVGVLCWGTGLVGYVVLRDR
jgi:uncharacterized membrane protein